jgi:hypothetical protein
MWGGHEWMAGDLTTASEDLTFGIGQTTKRAGGSVAGIAIRESEIPEVQSLIVDVQFLIPCWSSHR